jgi:steroid delta-isomerase-like uncharacterized protein
MSDKENTQFAEQAIAAINERNLDRYLQMLDESFTMENEMLPAPLKGREAVRQFFESYFKGIPDLHLEIEQVITSGDYVVVRSHLTGTHKGPLMGIPATNKKIDTHGCNVIQLRDGKAVRSRLYSDNATLFQQLGLLTIPKAMTAKP